MDNDEITKKFDFHSQRLNQIEKSMVNMERIALSMERINERVTNVEQTARENRKAWLGNGTPGYAEQIRDNKESIANIQKKLDKQNAILTSFLVAFILFFGGFTWALLTHEISIVLP